MAETKIRNALEDLEISEQDAEELIAHYIRKDPNRHGRDRARTGTDEGTVSVWIVISYLKGADIAEVAHAYDVPEDAIIAAIAYYRRHRELIDARLLLQNESFHRD
jgi:uncharacterized protein (DUF433 family)